ncbi:DUF108 domain-containing protein [Corticibacterium sp. UT-5YL-CI-8]|nr:DUF108 domain-containing protein [Tianweitania sp. UT-5YL-CI-8]
MTAAKDRWRCLRVNVIGFGRIGRPVVDFLTRTDGYELGSVLVRNGGAYPAGIKVTADPDLFFATGCDLIIDTAGPEALAAHGERALAIAETWTIGAAALADDSLRKKLENVGRQAGHRLRVLPGAIAGLDGVAAAAASGKCHVRLSISRPGLAGEREVVFHGSAREAASAHPNELNIAVAAALAGSGLDATSVELGGSDVHRLGLSVKSAFGTMSVDIELNPLPTQGLHPVSASIVAALVRERSVIVVG